MKCPSCGKEATGEYCGACGEPVRPGSMADDAYLGSPLLCDLGLALVRIPAGSFLMGSPGSEPERLEIEGPVHEVYLDEYRMGRIQVTNRQYQVFVAETGCREHRSRQSAKWQGADQPVVGITWDDAAAFCEWLARATGLRLRLPTEAQWEKACRAGTTTPFSFGETISTDQANYDGSHAYGRGRRGIFREVTLPAGSLPGNPWGIHDMHGNVEEWCRDRFDEGYYARSPARNPQGPDAGEARVLRGGSWCDRPEDLRSAFRYGNRPFITSLGVGFRVCLGSGSTETSGTELSGTG